MKVTQVRPAPMILVPLHETRTRLKLWFQLKETL